jgi:hypothetical protein
MREENTTKVNFDSPRVWNPRRYERRFSLNRHGMVRKHPICQSATQGNEQNKVLYTIRKSVFSYREKASLLQAQKYHLEGSGASSLQSQASTRYWPSEQTSTRRERVCVCVCVRKGMFDGWGGVTHRDAIGRLALLLVLRDLLTKHCGKGGVRVLANLRAWV